MLPSLPAPSGAVTDRHSHIEWSFQTSPLQTGKSFLAQALAVAAWRNKLSARYYRLADLARIFHWWGLLLVVGLGLWVVVWWGWLGPGRGVRPGAPFGGWWLF